MEVTQGNLCQIQSKNLRPEKPLASWASGLAKYQNILARKVFYKPKKYLTYKVKNKVKNNE